MNNLCRKPVFTLIALLQLTVIPAAAAQIPETEKCADLLRKAAFAESAACYRPLAEKGNTDAQAALAAQYLEGKGVRQDFAEALKWLKAAAEKGHLNSQNTLGNMYGSGKGAALDYAEAVRWYSKAAAQGLASSQNGYGFHLLTGRGVAQDYEEAVKWLRRSAEQGFATAQVNLAYCYELGKGVPLDYDEAAKWLRKASAQGNKDARTKLDKIESEKDKLNAPRLADAEYLQIARMAEDKYRDCDSALIAYLEVSEKGRRDTEWSLSTARAYECLKNYQEALYYYKRYDTAKPGQKKIAEKMASLSALMKEPRKDAPPVLAPRVQPQTRTSKPGDCLVSCLQERSKCGSGEKCRALFSGCADGCRENETWKNIAPNAAAADIADISVATFADYARVEIRLSEKIDFTKARILSPDRLFFDLKNSRIAKELQKTIKVEADMLRSVRSSQFNENTVRVVLDLKEMMDYRVYATENPTSLVIDIFRKN